MSRQFVSMITLAALCCLTAPTGAQPTGHLSSEFLPADEHIDLLQEAALAPRERWQSIFPPGPLPDIAWHQPAQIDSLLGGPPRVRWFDGALNEVTSARHPGRYVAYAEAKTSGGLTVRRARTFYCHREGWCPWLEELEMALPYPAGCGVEQVIWEEHGDYLSGAAGRDIFLQFLTQHPQGAILLAALSETEPTGRPPTQLESPAVREQDYQVALKRRLLGLEGSGRRLAPPRRRKGPPAPTLRSAATAAEAGFAADAAERIRAAAHEWVVASGEPFALVVARSGLILLHEGFGPTPEQTPDLNKPTAIASVQKTLTGLLFARFIDQGLIGLDDPVGRFLPGFPTEGPLAITFRHCFYHTSGFLRHGECGGSHNPWQENALACGVGRLEPGVAWNYNATGLDLAGKAMELVDGRGAIRLMHEELLRPLGASELSLIEDPARDSRLTALDLARLAQMLLNGGAYGELEFFSPATFEQIRPRQLAEVYPAWRDVPRRWGVEFIPMHYPLPNGNSGRADVPEVETAFSVEAFGRHGASGAFFLVDPPSGIVVAMARRDKGADYDRHLIALLRTIQAASRVAGVR